MLLPGETDDVKWVTFDEIHEMIRQKQICSIIAKQFLRQESMLKQLTQDCIPIFGTITSCNRISGGV